MLEPVVERGVIDVKGALLNKRFVALLYENARLPYDSNETGTMNSRGRESN